MPGTRDCLKPDSKSTLQSLLKSLNFYCHRDSQFGLGITCLHSAAECESIAEEHESPLSLFFYYHHRSGLCVATCEPEKIEIGAVNQDAR
jgi:hypothetical protein